MCHCNSKCVGGQHRDMRTVGGHWGSADGALDGAPDSLAGCWGLCTEGQGWGWALLAVLDSAWRGSP